MLEKQKITNKEKNQLSFYLSDDIKGTECLEYLFTLNNDFRKIYINRWKKNCIILIPISIFVIYICFDLIYKFPPNDIDIHIIMSLLLMALLSIILIIIIVALTDSITEREFLYYFDKKTVSDVLNYINLKLNQYLQENDHYKQMYILFDENLGIDGNLFEIITLNISEKVVNLK